MRCALVHSAAAAAAITKQLPCIRAASSSIISSYHHARTTTPTSMLQWNNKMFSSSSTSAAATSTNATSAASASSSSSSSSSSSVQVNPFRACDRLNPIPPRSAAHIPLCSPSDPVQFQYLADCSEEVRRECITAMWKEWQEFYRANGAQTVEDAIRDVTRDYSARDGLNMCIVATIDGKFACTASLATEDVSQSHPWYGTRPWFISLLAMPEYRGRGLSRLMFQVLEKRAELFGYQHLYLMTMNLQDYYGRLGYVAIETLHVHGRLNTLMRKSFADPKGQMKRFTVADAQAAHQAAELETASQTQPADATNSKL